MRPQLHRAALFTIAVAFASPLPAQLWVITEIWFTSGATVIELLNIGGAGSAANTSVCTTNPATLQYSSLPNGGPVATGSYVQVFLGQAGVNTPSQLFLPTFAPLSGSSGTVVLYLGTSLIPSSLMDYVTWGTSTSHIVDAYSVGQWESPFAFAPFPIPLGSSLAFDGTGNSSEDWYIDSTPTPGSANDVADMFLFGAGCAGFPGLPVLRRQPGSRPFTGSTFITECLNGPANLPVVFFAGLAQTGPFSLAPLGMPGCFQYISLDVTTAVVAGPSGIASFGIGIPLAPPLVGSVFFQQAFPFDPAANPFGFSATNAGQIIIGAN